MARRSHSLAFAVSCSTCLNRRFSSAIEEATCFFASKSCVFISTTIWFSIFSGSSERLIRSLMLDLMRVASLEKIPGGMVFGVVLGARRKLAQRGDLLRERHV